MVSIPEPSEMFQYQLFCLTVSFLPFLLSKVAVEVGKF